MKVTITITAADEEFGMGTSEYDVSGYLLELEEILSKVRMYLEEIMAGMYEGTVNKGLDYIIVNINSELVKLGFHDILYIIANGDYVQIRTTDKKVLVHSPLKEMQKKLPAAIFLKVHRSYIVNINKIVTVKADSIRIAGDIIPISRTYRETVSNKLKKI